MNNLKYGSMSITTERVTPAIAGKWLELNFKNRRLRPSVANQYARDMENGNWEMKPVAICFDEEGRLGNGQHTLTAIVLSGVTQELLVARSVPRRAIAFMDLGAKRTISDVANFVGAEVTSRQAGIARIMVYGVKDNKAKTFDELFNSYIFHKEAIDSVLLVAPGKTAGLNNTVLSVCARAMYTQDNAKIFRFLEILKTGIADGPSESAAIKLRDFSRCLKGAYSAQHRVELYEKTNSTLRSFIGGTPMTKVYGTSLEVFPIPEMTTECD